MSSASRIPARTLSAPVSDVIGSSNGDCIGIGSSGGDCVGTESSGDDCIGIGSSMSTDAVVLCKRGSSTCEPSVEEEEVGWGVEPLDGGREASISVVIAMIVEEG